MLRHEGETRTPAHDRRLAGSLALVAGFVNSAGFVLIGSFTSHVTGSVGRFANQLALGDGAALFAGLLVTAYFSGAFFASMTIESNVARNRPTTYGSLLICEAVALVAFGALSYATTSQTPRLHDVEGMLLCFAMGLQNSLVTRLSGAVVRTTHLTGVITDLGIESARWFRVWRERLSGRTGLRLVATSAVGVAPQKPKTILLLTILVAFLVGSVCGALGASELGRASIALPAAFLIAFGLYAILARQTIDTQPSRL
jgi:uncharacterized membrane protein YoaK (UPF0700 family)